MTLAAAPVSPADPVNRAILAVSEDCIQGFSRYPFHQIAEQAGIPVETVLERVRAMLEAGTIRRVRQTLLSTSLARGALVAWSVPASRLDAAFTEMFENDPFSGHVVLRSTDAATPGSQYRLWTTLKVPQGYSLDLHARYLANRVGATSYRLMPAKKLFALGVGHTRRSGTEPGSRDSEPATVINTDIVELDELEWRVLTALKREFEPGELSLDPWLARAAGAGVSIAEFVAVGGGLQLKGVIGRFSTFLEHVKELSTGEHVTRYNALFHWRVPPGMEIATGCEVGRHHIITHAYWREGGPEFANVNIMAVAHGMEKETVLAHKAAIDAHLSQAGIAPSYTNVFWGGRSEIKPSEISPIAYRDWCESRGIEPEAMLASPGEGEAS